MWWFYVHTLGQFFNILITSFCLIFTKKCPPEDNIENNEHWTEHHNCGNVLQIIRIEKWEDNGELSYTYLITKIFDLSFVWWDSEGNKIGKVKKRDYKMVERDEILQSRIWISHRQRRIQWITIIIVHIIGNFSQFGLISSSKDTIPCFCHIFLHIRHSKMSMWVLQFANNAPKFFNWMMTIKCELYQLMMSWSRVIKD